MARKGWQVGDKVSFINEVGGGVVAELLPRDQVLVLTDDGFEVPYPESALVKVHMGVDEVLGRVTDHQVGMVAANDEREGRVKRKGRRIAPEPPARLAVKRPDPAVMEIDLHLHELVDNERHMAPGDKLEYQIAYFERMLNTAIRDKKRTLIVIHGVGEGKLREEVRKVLQFYEGVRFHDADARRYGNGATEVFLPSSH